MPEAVIAMASVIPVYRSHRGSTPRGGGRQAEDGQGEHFDPVQPVHRVVEQVRGAG